MVRPEVRYKHFFAVKDGKIIWERKEMLDFEKTQLEGKRGFAVFEEVTDGPSTDQYGYYFGGIIRKECMVSNAFAGQNVYQIHSALMMETGHTIVTTYEHPKRGRIIHEVPQDIKKWSVKTMRNYIEQVIALLNTDYQIYPKPSEHFKDNKYYMDPKRFK